VFREECFLPTSLIPLSSSIASPLSLSSLTSTLRRLLPLPGPAAATQPAQHPCSADGGKEQKEEKTVEDKRQRHSNTRTYEYVQEYKDSSPHSPVNHRFIEQKSNGRRYVNNYGSNISEHGSDDGSRPGGRAVKKAQRYGGMETTHRAQERVGERLLAAPTNHNQPHHRSPTPTSPFSASTYVSPSSSPSLSSTRPHSRTLTSTNPQRYEDEHPSEYEHRRTYSDALQTRPGTRTMTQTDCEQSPSPYPNTCTPSDDTPPPTSGRVPLSSIVSVLVSDWSRSYTAAALNGDVDSMVAVARGHMRRDGWGCIPHDERRAQQWLLRAKRAYAKVANEEARRAGRKIEKDEIKRRQALLEREVMENAWEDDGYANDDEESPSHEISPSSVICSPSISPTPPTVTPDTAVDRASACNGNNSLIDDRRNASSTRVHGQVPSPSSSSGLRISASLPDLHQHHLAPIHSYAGRSSQNERGTMNHADNGKQVDGRTHTSPEPALQSTTVPSSYSISGRPSPCPSPPPTSNLYQVAEVDATECDSECADESIVSQQPHNDAATLAHLGAVERSTSTHAQSKDRRESDASLRTGGANGQGTASAPVTPSSRFDERNLHSPTSRNFRTPTLSRASSLDPTIIGAQSHSTTTSLPLPLSRSLSAASTCTY